MARPKARTGSKALGLFVTHPCASRNQTTHELAPCVSIAPVVKCPHNWGPPWEGYYELVPLPGLRNGENYVAKLGEVCSVRAEALVGHRIASLNQEGLVEALYHRLAMNSLRFPETPVHYKTEAARLASELSLWEHWTTRYGTEDGFQEWLDQPFGGQPHEDSGGNLIAGSERASGEIRRAVITWNYDDLLTELEESRP